MQKTEPDDRSDFLHIKFIAYLAFTLNGVCCVNTLEIATLKDPKLALFQG